MKVRSKFKPGDVIYFKYPSRYTRSSDKDRIECIIKIVSIAATDQKYHYNSYHYIIKILKTVAWKPGHWSDGEAGMGWTAGGKPVYNEEFGVDSIEIETYSRQLTPAEKVLYG